MKCGAPAATLLLPRVSSQPPAAGGRLPAPRPLPTFKPIPFKQDKFLSIKSRNAETYFSSRKQILKRTAEIQAQVKKLQEKHRANDGPLAPARDERNTSPDKILFGAPLTSHMADEIDAWNRNLRNIEAMQGLVLSDELVYMAISSNVRLGAFPYVLDWLKKCAREQRLPLPTGLLHDMCTFVYFAQSVLPSSNMSMVKTPEVLLEMTSVKLTTRRVNENTSSSGFAAGGLSDEETTVDDVHGSIPLVNSTPYARYLLEELYVPVWKSLQQLGLLPSVRSNKKDETDWKHFFQEETQNDDDMALGVIGRLCSCASSSVVNNNTPMVNDIEKTTTSPSALAAYTELLLALAQTAAEAKEINFLIELQLIFCSLFIEPTITKRGEENEDEMLTCSRWKLKKTAWCKTESDYVLLCRFANDFLAAIYYGRLAWQSEESLDLYLRSFMDNMKSACNENPEDKEETTDNDDNMKAVEEEEEEYDKETTPSSLSSSLHVSLENVMDEMVKSLFQKDASLFADATTYAAMVLNDSTLLPSDTTMMMNSSFSSSSSVAAAAGNTTCRFSQMEVEWMRRHCDLLHRCKQGENIKEELKELFLPGGVVAESLKTIVSTSSTSSSISSNVDMECFLALVVETIVSMSSEVMTPEARGSDSGMNEQKTTMMTMSILPLMKELCIRLEEVQKQNQKGGEEKERSTEVVVTSLLPLYSAVSAMILLFPLLDLNCRSAGSSGEESGKVELGDCSSADAAAAAACHDDVKCLIQDITRGVLKQPICFGNAYSVVLMILTEMEMWGEVLSLLRKLDNSSEESSCDNNNNNNNNNNNRDLIARGISSALVDQRVWACVFRRARDAGQAAVCLFLRERREKLFY